MATFVPERLFSGTASISRHADHPIPFYVPYTVMYDNSCADEVQRRGDRGA